MSLLQRLEVFQRAKRAKVQAEPSEGPSGAMGAISRATQSLNDHQQSNHLDPGSLDTAELSNSAPASCQAQDAGPSNQAAASGSQGDLEQERDTNAQRRESRMQSPVSGKTKLAVSDFYGKSRLRLVERCILRLLAAAQKKVQGIVDDPFQIFPLQEPAFKWADANGAKDLRIFSVERSADGKRSFLVSTYRAFWARYQGMLPHHRHYYEIIRQGWPCHLYFDLEYPMQYNKDTDGNQLVDTLLHLCSAALKERFDIELDESWVVELDSSSPSKFSRHLVIPIPGAAFQSNFHVGAFVKELCEVPSAAKCPDEDKLPRQELLITKDAEGGQALFVDGGVYTRNRAFRLFMSSKAGKDAILLPTDRSRGAQLSHKDTFYSALICNVQQGCRLLQCFDDTEGATFSWTGSRGGSRADAVTSLERCPNPQMGPSRHPDIEEFITSMCNQGGTQGQVRSWVDWPEAGLLLLNMRSNRWCGNIGRAHKSNGIFYVIDLQGGAWYQKCYDPECRHYRSQIMPLPPAIMQRLQAEAASRGPSTSEQQGHTPQPSAHEGYSAMAWDPNLPCAAEDGVSSKHARQHPHRRHHIEQMEKRMGTGAVPDDLIVGFGTGVFDRDSADDEFDKELLQLSRTCQKDRFAV